MKKDKGGNKKSGFVEKIVNKYPLKTLLITVVMVVLAFANVAQSVSLIKLQHVNSDLKEEMFDYKNENKVLTEKLETIGTDQYVEEKAREDLGMIKSDETPIKIVEKEKEKKESEVENIEANDKIGIYMKDWYEKLNDWIEMAKK